MALNGRAKFFAYQSMIKMPERRVLNEYDREQAVKWLAAMDPPYVVSVVKGKGRSQQQNRLMWKLCGEIAKQLGDQTPADVHAYIKLHHGVPIMRAEDVEFREVYDDFIKPRSYEDKLRAMKVLDFSVTRDMTTAQFTRFLDAVYQEFTAQGLRLTVPDEPPMEGADD